jgi:hypothetical protein
MSKYRPLSERLAGHEGPEWRASFAEVEEVLGFPLPKTARSGRSWWSAADKPHARAWSQHGFEADVDHGEGTVTFRRGGFVPSGAEAPPEAPDASADYSLDVPPPPAERLQLTSTEVIDVKPGRKITTVGIAALATGAVAIVAGVGALVVRGMRRR